MPNTAPEESPALETPPPVSGGFVLKVAELCNLNCSYCYMYNKGDTSFRLRPKFMTAEVATATLHRIASYARRRQFAGIEIALHGGEPLLAGHAWMRWFLETSQQIASSEGVIFELGLQTNGTLLDDEWVELFSRFNVQLGISCDGPPEWHDAVRIDHAGSGSYAEVRRAIDLLHRKYKARWGVLTVANPEAPARVVLQHFADLGVPMIDFLWPDFNHDAPPPWPPGTLGMYYRDLFDFWYSEMHSEPRVRWFESAIRLLLGGHSSMDALGPNPITDIMVESDGSWEPLDVLRTCENGFTRTKINALTHDVEAIFDVPLYKAGLHNQELLPPVCRSCAYRNVCGGGYLPHRYSRRNGFANPSVHCVDLLAVLTHIRERLAADLQQLSMIPRERACSAAL